MNLNTLKEKALGISGKVTVYWPQYDRAETISPQTELLDRTFATNNGIVAFTDKQILYVIPYFNSAIECLLAEGFKKRTFYVPFSNGEYPVFYKERWKELKRDFREQ